jgi:hypothetical protein
VETLPALTRSNMTLAAKWFLFGVLLLMSYHFLLRQT